MDANGLKSLPMGGFIPVGKNLVFGKTIDGLTRCVHYHSSLDIIAIKFPCCNRYYPCHSCHEDCAGHTAEVWPRSRFNDYVILCGACGTEHTIENYLADLPRARRGSIQSVNCTIIFTLRSRIMH